MKKVLIVDDTDMNRAILAEILEGEYELIEAGTGKEAVAIMEEQRDDLAVVLLDLVMPEMDGFEVLKVMNEREWIEKLPVLVITSEHTSETEDKCFEYGVSDFIRKPFSNMLVKMRVRNITRLFCYKNELESHVMEQLANPTSLL